LKLALDTSQSSGSIALATVDQLLYSAYFDLRVTHSETLMPAIDAALKACKASPKQLSQLYVCMGPGSFTGLRIGLATVKGIAYALGIPVLGYTSLHLAALPCGIANRKILSVIDAKMKEIYAAMYNPDLSILHEPRVLSPDAILEWDLQDCIVTGSGTEIVRKVLEEAGKKVSYAPQYFRIPRAEALYSLAELVPAQNYDQVTLAELEPLYLRESTAQIKRQQKTV